MTNGGDILRKSAIGIIAILVFVVLASGCTSTDQNYETKLMGYLEKITTIYTEIGNTVGDQAQFNAQADQWKKDLQSIEQQMKADQVPDQYKKAHDYLLQSVQSLEKFIDAQVAGDPNAVNYLTNSSEQMQAFSQAIGQVQ